MRSKGLLAGCCKTACYSSSGYLDGKTKFAGAGETFFNTLLGAALAICLAATPSPVAAQPAALRAGTRPLWFSFGLGPAITIYNEPFVSGPDQIKLWQSFGYHFSGNSSGPALGVELQESFADDWVVLELGPKFCWDIQLAKNLALYLSPSLLVGFAAAFPTWNFFGFKPDTGLGITVQFGLDVKLILYDRLLLRFQPLSFDLGNLTGGNWREWYTFLRYEMIFGVGVTF